jgi:predicted lipoprotein
LLPENGKDLPHYPSDSVPYLQKEAAEEESGQNHSQVTQGIWQVDVLHPMVLFLRDQELVRD